jgi:hypothetical protein
MVDLRKSLIDKPPHDALVLASAVNEVSRSVEYLAKILEIHLQVGEQ